jgi:adenylate cyclase
LDRIDEAQHLITRLLAEEPKFTRAFAEKKLFFLKREDQLHLYLDGLGKAGVSAG